MSIEMIITSIKNFLQVLVTPDSLSGLFWNVFVTILGIILTVKFVDEKAKKREASRWQPVINNIYYNLFWEFSSIVMNLKLCDKWNEIGCYHYYFGDYYVAVPFDVAKINHKEIEDKIDFSKIITPHILNIILNNINNVNTLINSNSNLIEPELLHLHFIAKEIFDHTIRTIEFNSSLPEVLRSKKFQPEFLAEYLFNILIWLEKKSTKFYFQN